MSVLVEKDLKDSSMSLTDVSGEGGRREREGREEEEEGGGRERR